MLILTNKLQLKGEHTRYSTNTKYKINSFLKINKKIPKIILYQNYKYSINFFFFNLKFKLGTIKHSTLGVFNSIFFPHSSKKKNIKILIKILYFFIKDTIEYTSCRVVNILKSFTKIYSSDNNFKIINKSYFDENFKLSVVFNNKKLLRLKKKKRSLQRKSRKKIFNSTFGRIWLT